MSTEGGEVPLWSTTGDELFFWRNRTLMSSKVLAGESFTHDAPKALFEVAHGGGRSAYVVAPDGNFILSEQNPEAMAREIHVVEHWVDQLKSLAPAE